MKRLILHIGWPKSGTSSIQGVLANNPEGLEKIGILYPTVERRQDAHHAACGLFVNHQDPLIPQPDGDLLDFINYLNSEKYRHLHTAIISSEGLCRAVSIKPNLLNLTSHLEVTVVACFRDPLIWANSLFNQLIKMSLFFGDSIDLELLARGMVLQNLRYSQRLQIWADAFGRKNVKILPFEEGADFSALFFDSLGIERSILPNEAHKNSKNNSLPIESLRIIQMLHRNQIEMTREQKIRISQLLNSRRGGIVPNILDAEITGKITLEREKIANDLSNNWLDGRSIFSAAHELPIFEDINLYDRNESRELAEGILNSEPEILNKLLKVL